MRCTVKLYKWLYPDYYIKNIEHLPLKDFKRKGIEAIVFDIDNTIAPYDVAEPDDWAMGVLDNLKAEGFKICLLSNNNEKRINIFNKKIGAYAFWKAGKPGTKGVKEAMAAMGTTPETTVMVGDQVFTDVLCGHNAGMLSVMTAPLCNRDQLITKVKRPLEKLVMSYYFRRRKKHGR